MATREQVRTMQTSQPFAPFLVKLVDGRSFEVTHPELVACSKDGRSMTLYDDDGMHLLEMLLVAEITPAGRPASPRRKAAGIAGQNRRRAPNHGPMPARPGRK